MTNETLLIKASKLGLQTHDTEGQDDPNHTLAEVVKSYNQRLWEAFPVMLASVAEAGDFSYEAANASLEEEERKYLKLLVMVSLGLYDALALDLPWRKRLFGAFPARLIGSFSEKLKLNTGLELGKVTLQPEKLRGNLQRYSQNRTDSPMSGKKREETALEAALAQIFTTRQKELLLKRLNGEKLTKTETEYFSRVIKKKAQALANEDLHRLARRALE